MKYSVVTIRLNHDATFDLCTCHQILTIEQVCEELRSIACNPHSKSSTARVSPAILINTQRTTVIETETDSKKYQCYITRLLDL